ncbi:hypothetical protein [uncultured Tateyamaria sp.]|uniref:hypothetical protein n=1 Tax=uncultured Tateyamaria sp. TaxID=455651 RepID=UPI00262EB853|nr:hypothetical protein [uncultured Tateyamaria sp.]
MSSHPKRQVLIKFGLLLSLLVGYFAYLNYQYDLATSGIVALLTWSFFVLCTPVADAGFLLDFPLRLLFGIRMVISEIAVWAVAGAVNVTALLFWPNAYDTTVLTRAFHTILTTPVPYWAVIALSAIGTFLSIRFADELMDVIHHHDRHFFHSHHFKHELVLFGFFLAAMFGYYRLMSSIGLDVG